MNSIQLGRTDIRLSPVIMGTWQTGKNMWTGIDDKESEKAIQSAFDNGITTFDTAEVYGNGHSEKIVGKALKTVREKVVITTKVFSNHLKYDQVIGACNRSLKNLGTDYIDLYQIHWPSGSFGSKVIPVDETIRALDDLLKQGKIRSIGVSNFSKDQLEEITKAGDIQSLQPPYSLFWRQLEKDAMDFCQKNAITILAYSSMAQGLLTGKFGPGHQFEKGDHRSANRLFAPENYKRVQEAIGRLTPIAKEKNITLGQLALAWVISHENTCAIAGARNAVQAAENAAACEIRLTKDELSQMDVISKNVTDHIDNNPVLWKW